MHILFLNLRPTNAMTVRSTSKTENSRLIMTSIAASYIQDVSVCWPPETSVYAVDLQKGLLLSRMPAFSLLDTWSSTRHSPPGGLPRKLITVPPATKVLQVVYLKYIFYIMNVDRDTRDFIFWLDWSSVFHKRLKNYLFHLSSPI